jgi:transcription-repair coupling factor (superfamily II helicase)
LLGLATTLDTHNGFAEVVASLRAGHGGTIGGTWGSASALTSAALAEALASAPDRASLLVVVLPHAADADFFLDDLTLFTPLPVAVLPALESGGVSSGVDPTEADRLALVKRLIGPPAAHPRIVVTTIQALLSPLPDPREIEASTRRLAVGARLDPAELADWLIARGWEAAAWAMQAEAAVARPWAEPPTRLCTQRRSMGDARGNFITSEALSLNLFIDPFLSPPTLFVATPAVLL